MTSTTADDIRDLVHEASRIAREGGTDAERKAFAARKATLLAGIDTTSSDVDEDADRWPVASTFQRQYLRTPVVSRECEVQLLPRKAAGVQAVMRSLNDGVTPCEAGLRCPLLPASDRAVGATR